ncbi:endonuclease/exonuclease/phosphatase family protein [Gemelliphila palaticanis]|uniref:Endonuclease/exonuclease/phosphatase family protein n=1 Tax=Gemelliphila palaticanis TaxID=81950 RepID=A0ABX2SYJ9_9BACL|nr:endonuclease/exonuclease/phosphatase family protein [Gemella palaticanis]MBF0715475.1 endonuclease/exonuclease/phosphatase family protein [Gemella palaticanis]NYS47405.1 endonuclease/exonuclease/phosphatase family protein [Gemella palaticanis]
MKLLTVNVHAWLEENQLEKIDILAKRIAEESYDVVALQEVNQLISSKIVMKNIKADNYGLLLLEKVNKYSDEQYYFYWSNSHIGFDKYDEGISIITKHKVKDIDEFYCTNSTTINSIESRKIIKATIEYQNRPIEFYSCHMNLPNSKNEDFYENLDNIINRTINTNLKIFMGDFNTDAINNKKDYEKIINKGLFDTYSLAKQKDSGITVYKNISGWEECEKQKRLDYIFTNQNIEVEYSNVLFNGKNLPIISDHNGLEVKINI